MNSDNHYFDVLKPSPIDLLQLTVKNYYPTCRSVKPFEKSLASSALSRNDWIGNLSFILFALRLPYPATAAPPVFTKLR